MTSSPSSPPSAAAGLASSIVVYILYTCACTHNKQTVFFSYYKSVCWSRRVELLLGNFYYLYARTVRLLCIHPSSNCWQAAHAVVPRLTSFSFPFTTIYWQPQHSNNHPRERDSEGGESVCGKRGVP